MTRTLSSLACCAAFGLISAPAMAQQSGYLRVDFLGPGGHSQNNYGRTSALHAASRTAMLIQQSLPGGTYVITNLTGGNSVNSIASDGLIELRLSAANPGAYQALVTTVSNAASTGAAAENTFRSVNVGDLTGGVPAWIRYTIADQATMPPAMIEMRRAAKRPVAAKRGVPDIAGHDHSDPTHVCDQ